MLNSYIKVLKKSAGTQSRYGQRNTPGMTSSKINLKLGYPFPPASNLTYLAPPGQFFMDAKLFPGTPLNYKKMFLKK